MADLAVLGIEVRPKGIDKATADLKGLSTQSGAVQTATGKMADAFDKLGQRILAINQGMDLFNRVFGAAWSGIMQGAKVETLNAQLGVLLKSTEKAKTVYGEWQALAAKTPLETEEIAQAGKMLLAYGTSMQSVTNVLTRLGDISSGVGMNLTDLAAIYGKIQTQGRIFADDLNQMGGRGIPIIKSLAQVMGVAENQVRALVEKGKVGFPEVQAAFKSLTDAGGDYAGMMAKMSETTEGKLSTMQDNINQSIQKIALVVLPAVKSIMDAIGGLAQAFTDLTPGAQAAVLALGTVGAAAIALPPLIGGVKTAMMGLSAFITGPGGWILALASAVAVVVALGSEIVNAEKKMQQATRKRVEVEAQIRRAGFNPQVKSFLTESEMQQGFSKEWSGYLTATPAWAQNIDGTLSKLKELADYWGVTAETVDQAIRGGGVKGGAIEGGLSFQIKQTGDAAQKTADQATAMLEVIKRFKGEASAGPIIDMTGLTGARDYGLDGAGKTSPYPFAPTGVGYRGLIFSGAGNADYNQSQGPDDMAGRLGVTQDALRQIWELLGMVGMATEDNVMIALKLGSAFQGVVGALGEIAKQGYINTMTALGKALASGSDAGQSFADSMAKIGLEILNQLPLLLLSAGLQLIAQGLWPVGLGLVAASGMIALTAGAVQAGIAEKNGKNYARGGILTNPTRFGNDLAGEAGPEAVLPLTRLTNGTLGVAAAGGGSGAVTVNVINNTGAEVKTEEREGPDGRTLEIIIGGVVQNMVGSGKLDRAMSSRFGVRYAGAVRS